jgi:methylenetetrahydrofolate reductase (NADPH)
MYIRDLLNDNQTTISCELFPPKEDDDFVKAKKLVKESVVLNPDFISVTFGANGSNHRNSIEMASHVEELGVTVLQHLTCQAATREIIEELIVKIKASGIQNVLALRGDIPEDTKDEPRVFNNAVQLVQLLKEKGGLCVGAGCCPEGHPESVNLQTDIEFLKEKVDAGCDFVTSQMFFDNSVLYKFLSKIRAKGIHVPVIAGIMPVVNSKSIKSIVELSGAMLPSKFLNIVDKFADDPLAMEEAGIAYAEDQIVDLVANGVNYIHLYSMNRPRVAKKVMDDLSHILRASR